jgi:signal transduction histidine kinase/HAMP domain-containing protein
MAQQAVDPARPNTAHQSLPRSISALGMRGGLGKTLLIAFLLLAIVPLGLLAFLTNSQIQRDTSKKLIASLETTVALKEAHVAELMASYERELRLLASPLARSLEPEGATGLRGPALSQLLTARLDTMRRIDPAWVALLVVDQTSGELVASTDPDLSALETLQPPAADGRRMVIVPVATMGDGAGEGTPSPPLLAVRWPWAGWQLIGLLQGDALQQIVTHADDPERGITTSLITGDGLMLSGQGLTRPFRDGQEALPQDVLEALPGGSGSGSYADHEGALVFSAYRWDPELEVTLLTRQPQAQALAAGDALTALVVGATLAVALITAASAAIVTRRVTRPIVQLTETAAWMARGDLNQRVTVLRNDEIGVLARAFNHMAAELRTLYASLEAKVAERTQQLEAARQRAKYHAMQLTISAEVARVVSSIRNLDTLLSTVVELIGKAFELHHVSIHLLDDEGRWVVRQAGSQNDHGLPVREAVGGGSLVGRVAADGQRQLVRVSRQEPCSAAPSPVRGAKSAQAPVLGAGSLIAPETSLVPGTTALKPPVECELVLPLRVRERVLGVIDLQSSRPKDFGENDQMVYQALADQISIAIENARAYAVERETVEKLRELDRIQSQFLTHMSHALRTPLNSIIGFSRVMLKELDGPLNDLQRTDLTAIHESGRQLLGLINDMLELSQLDLGTAPFAVGEVGLTEIIEGVMATVRALARSKPIQLHEEVPENLPVVYTDGHRVRQVILALLSNAVKFTDEGSIHLRVARDDGHITISIRDTGIGIPPAERAKVFTEILYSEASGEQTQPGFGLAISKRVVEKLGGQIWLESQEGVGSTFTFTLPIRPAGMQPVPQENDEEVK